MDELPEWYDAWRTRAPEDLDSDQIPDDDSPTHEPDDEEEDESLW